MVRNGILRFVFPAGYVPVLLVLAGVGTGLSQIGCRAGNPLAGTQGSSTMMSSDDIPPAFEAIAKDHDIQTDLVMHLSGHLQSAIRKPPPCPEFGLQKVEFDASLARFLGQRYGKSASEWLRDGNGDWMIYCIAQALRRPKVTPTLREDVLRQHRRLIEAFVAKANSRIVLTLPVEAKQKWNPVVAEGFARTSDQMLIAVEDRCDDFLFPAFKTVLPDDMAQAILDDICRYQKDVQYGVPNTLMVTKDEQFADDLNHYFQNCVGYYLYRAAIVTNRSGLSRNEEFGNCSWLASFPDQGFWTFSMRLRPTKE